MIMATTPQPNSRVCIGSSISLDDERTGSSSRAAISYIQISISKNTATADDCLARKCGVRRAKHLDVGSATASISTGHAYVAGQLTGCLPDFTATNPEITTAGDIQVTRE